MLFISDSWAGPAKNVLLLKINNIMADFENTFLLKPDDNNLFTAA